MTSVGDLPCPALDSPTGNGADGHQLCIGKVRIPRVRPGLLKPERPRPLSAFPRHPVRMGRSTDRCFSAPLLASVLDTRRPRVATSPRRPGSSPFCLQAAAEHTTYVAVVAGRADNMPTRDEITHPLVNIRFQVHRRRTFCRRVLTTHSRRIRPECARTRGSFAIDISAASSRTRAVGRRDSGVRPGFGLDLTVVDGSDQREVLTAGRRIEARIEVNGEWICGAIARAPCSGA